MSFGPGPHASLGLDHDLPDLAVEVEVVDVVAAEIGLERREQSVIGTSSRLALVRSSVEPELGHPGREGREDPGQLGPLAGLVQEPVDDFWSARPPCPSRSSIMSSKPPVWLRPRIGGGWRTITMASRTAAELAPGASAARPRARSSGVFRSSSPPADAKTSPQLVWLVEVIDVQAFERDRVA